MKGSGLNQIASSLRRRLSIGKTEDVPITREYVENLPPLKSITAGTKRNEAVLQKCNFCNEIVDFDSIADESKILVKNKRKVLLDLVDFLSVGQSKVKQDVIDEASFLAIVTMIKRNIFITQPPQPENVDEDEDEPILDSAWPHKQVVYELLLRLVVNSDFNAKLGKKEGLIDADFCTSLIDLFKSDDPRERDYLKTVLHRIYGKFMCHRGHIRKMISFVFAELVETNGRSNGIAELLEILGSIINGFAMPLKPEHLQFIEKTLIPLHKYPNLALYASQLTYCVTQYIEKDQNTAITVINSLVNLWPWTSSQKQVILLNELEEILELITPSILKIVARPLYSCLAKCICSEHFQICERTLFLWNNDQVLHLFVAEQDDNWTNNHFNIIYPAVLRNIDGVDPHWNAAVTQLSYHVIDIYKGVLGSDHPLLNSKIPNTQQHMKKRLESWASLESQIKNEDIEQKE